MMETKDCTPHISLFLSFRSVATAIHMLEVCCGPFFNSFWWSLWLTVTETILQMIGAFNFRSSANSFQVIQSLSTGICLCASAGGLKFSIYNNK